MVELTPNLDLPYVAPSQAQKHVTHNEAIRALDAIVQLGVADRDLTAPPASPVAGARYIVNAVATGLWSGHENDVAAWQDGAWLFYTPMVGWVAWIADEDALVAWNGSSWVAAGGGGVNPTPLVGVNATADVNNRLAVASPASLFNHVGNGHQQKINKAAAGDTASVLFQTGFSGRAEFGTTGDDDWHVKVSPNGADWFEALVADRNTGRVFFPNTAGREVLTANRTYFVAATGGNNNNDGLSADSPLATFAEAFNRFKSIDPNGFVCKIKLMNGTHEQTAVYSVNQPLVNGSTLQVEGNPVNPSMVVLRRTTAGVVLQSIGGANVLWNGITTRNDAGGSQILTISQSASEFRNMRYGDAGGSSQVQSTALSRVLFGAGTHEIIGGGVGFAQADTSSDLACIGRTITLTGTPAYISGFARAIHGGSARFTGTTFVGAATGPRFFGTTNGVIVTGGGTLPGNADGVLETGAQQI